MFARFTAVNDRLSRSFLGASLQRGVGESFGFNYGKGGVSQGFLGLRGNPLSRGKGLSGVGRMGGSLAMRGLGLAFTINQMYQGYKEEGVLGAVKGGAESIVWNTAFQAAARAAPGLVAVGIIGGAGYGAYRFGEAAQAHRKRVRGLEFGTGPTDMMNSFGAVTERQRAQNALYSTHINGRMAIGNEGQLLHSSYR